MSRPSLVSFITPVCNQGDEARATVANAREAFGDMPHEIIVVDDHSIDGSCHGMPKDVLVVRTEHRDGVSSARRCGFAQSRGDVLIWSDPHCRFPPGSLAHLATLASNREAVFQPLNVPDPKSRVRHGGQLVLSSRGLRVKRAFRRAAPFPALYGTIYAMQRTVYEHLGGWPRLPGIWSYSEQALTLMNWYMKVPIIVDTAFRCLHKSYQPGKKFPFSVRGRDRANNAHFVHAVFFPKSYPGFWKPLLDRRFGKSRFDAEILESRDFNRLRRHLRRHARRTEEQFFQDVLGMAPPIDAFHGSSADFSTTFRDDRRSERLSPPMSDAGMPELVERAAASVESASASTGRESVPGVIYRENPPTGDAYTRQQSLRSRPGEYHSTHPRVEIAMRWALGELPDGYLRGKSVVDAGTRDGFGVVLLQGFAPSFAEGIELVPNTAARARRRGRPVRHGDMADLPYADGEIDLVTCIHALEHCPNPLGVVREFARVLRPGGLLFIVVPRDDKPEADQCHNCAFPTVDALIGLVARSDQFDVTSLRQSIGTLGRGKRELRLLVTKKQT